MPVILKLNTCKLGNKLENYCCFGEFIPVRAYLVRHFTWRQLPMDPPVAVTLFKN